MKNTTAVAASTGMVVLAAITSGGLFLAAQGTSAAAPADAGPDAPAPEVVVEYVDANGNVVPVDTTTAVAPAAAAPTAASPGEQAYGGGEYEEDEYESEYAEGEYEEDEAYEDDHDEDYDDD